MGLTINWNIEFNGTAKQLHAKLEKIRQKCMDLPFEDVDEVETITITQKMIDTYDNLQKKYTYPNNTDENLAKRDKELEKLGISTWRMIEAGEVMHEEGGIRRETKPTTMVSLYLWPGKGCESSELNFCKRGEKFVCKSFCKTQYAEHFVQCHLLVIQLLDLLKAEDFIMENVHDEGGFWETKDISVLAKNINESTAMISSILGGLQSAAKKAGMTVEAPITESQNYLKVDEN